MTYAPLSLAATTLVEDLTFGESPRWHGGRLWFSDFYSHGVWSIEADGSDRRPELEVRGRPSGLGWLPDGRLLAVSMEERAVLRREDDGTASLHADLRAFTTCEANDLLVLEDGTAFIGQFGFDLQEFLGGSTPPRLTSMLRMDETGAVEVAAEDLCFPNGMVRLGSTLVVAETFAHRLTAFGVRADGTLGARRDWALLEGCYPDGICGDAEGAVWVANANARECLRVREGGEVLARVATSRTCFACMLGGEDRRTLYCCTAPGSHEDRAGRRAARIEIARVEVPGAGLP
ncbi:MAG TPA: SMP-30/gluconolactonase/LRE family protein [Acidimicrobiales bacterium]|nr:SMP-30/gluconolactonase/LRE family protein [Acidimicrobiales bacterium]